MYDFKKTEEEMLKFWNKNKIWEKSKKKNSKGKKFYFLQGPPYTSGRLHIGHAWNNSLKDLIMRYKRMRGFDVWDRAGYDMHGLPTANKVQEKLKLVDKEAILKYGLDKFVKECQKFSLDNAKLMSQDLKRLGIWMDYENAYLPVTNEFMSAEWLLIKKAYEQNRLYRGKKIMQWCATCETSLAKHELEYKNVSDKSIYVAFKLKNNQRSREPLRGKKGSLVIWTTTPWTIPFNLGVMVNPDLDYSKVSVGDEIYYVAKDLVEKFGEVLGEIPKVIESFKGKTMKGWEYSHPFSDIIDYDSLKKESPKIHTILMSKKYVNLEAGTGLVHCAPGCGPEDYEVGQENKIKLFNKINEQGVFQDMGEFDGMIAKVDDWKFIKALNERGAILGEEKVLHEYAHCWRCHNPIVFRATEQWFLKIEDLLSKIINYNKKITWVPEFAKKNYESWIENLRDNGLTRQRFWGTPIPIWTCECGKMEVIGSQEELAKKATAKLPTNLHKPWIDKVKIKCECGKEMSRDPDVLDVWIDSGTASWNCLEYPQKKNYFEKYFPADLILEATEQTRLWFSMLQVCSEIVFKKSSYKNVFATGMIFDFQGTKMSKSLGNIISPYEVIDKYSSDIFRYYICEITAGENLSFNWEDIKQKQRNLLVLIHIKNYLLDLLKQGKLKKLSSKDLGVEERYILSRTNSTIKNVTELFEGYNIDKTIPEIEKLFLDLSRVYIKLTRDKSNDVQGRDIVLSVIWEVYEKVLKMFSCISPLITESLWQEFKEVKLVEEESVHLSSWPKVDSKKLDTKLEDKFEIGLQIIEKGLSERDKNQIGLKWPLPSAIIKSEKKIEKDLQKVIMNQLNVKKIEVKNAKEISVEFDTKMTPELEAEGYAREMSRQVQSFRKKIGLEKKDKIELSIIVEGDFVKILKSKKDFIADRTNSKKVEIVTTRKERFKNIIDFKIKDKRGEIVIITPEE